MDLIAKIYCTCGILIFVGAIISLLTLDSDNPIAELLEKVMPYMAWGLALISALSLVVVTIIEIWSR